MINDTARAEMRFYAETGDYSDPERYERFALSCELDKKALEIGDVVRLLASQMPDLGKPLRILETASATGLTAVGVTAKLREASISHTYTSLDIEPNLLNLAKFRKRGDFFVQGDFELLPFASGTFNIYIMMGAEGYRPNGKFYPEVWRVLRAHGYYVMPQIGPRGVVGAAEITAAAQVGLGIIRADNFLVAQKT